MKIRVFRVLLATVLLAPSAFAQQKTVTGKITDEQGIALQSVSVIIRGTTTGTMSGREGLYSIRVAPGQVLQFRLIGTSPAERTVGVDNVINVQLRRVATSLDAVVVTALGQTTEQRALGTAQQTVNGADIAGTQRENFINALQGRVAGVNVTSTSGTPGASTSIVIRGVSQISSSNQPLMIVDGLPIDNKTMTTGTMASDAPNSNSSFDNRKVDFTNRGADLNPEDIETLTVLKGPEASALYGIDAANGAIVITTKRGKPGSGQLDYSNSLRFDTPRVKPELQSKYGPTAATNGIISTFQYFGAPYAAGTTLYDNVAGFFQTALTQKHNLSFSGGATDGKMNYRVASSYVKQNGVVPEAGYTRLNLTGASGAQVTSWLKTDLSMQYANATNKQSFKGDGGVLLGLLVWPQTDNAADFLTPQGVRRRITALSQGAEYDNPYFNVEKNIISSKTNRFISNLGVVVMPFTWGTLKSNIGIDAYTNQNLILRHPESFQGTTFNGAIDQADDITRNVNAQTLLNFNRRQLTRDLTISGLLGNGISDAKSTTDGLQGQNFLDPNFVSVNNTYTKYNRQVNAQRRLVSAYGQATLDYKRFLYLTVTGRNDWTSTIPTPNNSFFYPSISSSFIFSDAIPSLGRHMTGKLRAAFAEVGKDAKPYAYAAALEPKTTSFGGYAYGFTGPNPNLKPEFAKSYELGTELGFLNDRLGLDVTVYRKRTIDPILEGIRTSYGTGFILLNVNGGEIRNQGLEITLRGTPVLRNKFSWDILANYESARGKVIALPRLLPEFYLSDTWIYQNVRNGTAPGLSTMSLTGTYYQRNAKGDILIDPTSGLPLRSADFIDRGYDRQPFYTVGLSNTLKYGPVNVNFLLDIRRGGDVFNATQHYLTQRGLATSTLDRETPRVVKGVLRDGKENTANPTPNSISVNPSVQTTYYSTLSEELFIEKNINWIRLRDITLNYQLPERLVRARTANIFVTATDVFMITNYTGLDPLTNSNTAGVGGSGGVGIDYGSMPIPRGVNLGLRLGF